MVADTGNKQECQVEQVELESPVVLIDPVEGSRSKLPAVSSNPQYRPAHLPYLKGTIPHLYIA